MNNYLIGFLLCGMACFAILLLVFPGENALIVSSVANILFLIIIIWEYKQKCKPLFIAFCAFYLLSYPIGAIAISFFPEAKNYMMNQGIDSYCLALGVAMIGFVSFIIGFYGDWIDKAVEHNRKTRIVWLIVLIGLGIAAKIFISGTFFSQQYEDTYSSIGILPSIVSNVGLVLAISLFSRDAKYNIVSMGVVIIYSIMGIFIGQRSGFFEPIVIFIIFIFIIRATKIVKRSIIALSLLVILIISLMPVLTILKGEITSGRKNTTSIERAKMVGNEIFNIFENRNINSDQGDPVLMFLKRYSHIQFGGFLIKNKNNLLENNIGLSSVIQGITIFVPRYLWQDKPTIGLGEEVYKLMGYSDKGSATVPLSSELYIGFGILGTAFGLALFGYFNKLIMLKYSNRNNIMGASLAFLMYHNIQMGQGIANAIGINIIYLITFIFLSIMISVKDV